MPQYTYRFDDTGEETVTFQHIHEETLTQIDGRDVERVPSLAAVRTQFGAGNGCKPIKMLSIALDNEDEIAEFRIRNPGVTISSKRSDPDFGVPVAHSRREKLRILDREGFVEAN